MIVLGFRAQETRTQALQSLAVEVLALQHVEGMGGIGSFKEHQRRVEGLLVATLGHWDASARRRAVRLLNALYDGIAWQLDAPFAAPVLTTVGTSCSLTVHTSLAEDAPPDSAFAFQLSSPCWTREASTHSILTLHAPDSYDQEPGALPGSRIATLQLQLPPFPRCGFYDWRLVSISPDGIAVPVVPCPAAEDAAPHSPSSLPPSVPPGALIAQGRFIVHPQGTGAQRMHEVLVDLHSPDITPDGQVVAHGTFSRLAEAMPDLAAQGVEVLHVQGAMERDNGWLESSEVVQGLHDSQSHGVPGSPPSVEIGRRGLAARPDASPHAIVSRSTPCAMLGGRAGFKALLDAASSNGVQVMVPLHPHVAAARAHRCYREMLAMTLDEGGCPVRHPGTDGVLNQWEDTSLLNYRLLPAWEVLVEEAKALASQLGVNGVYIMDASSLPLIMEADASELGRVDVDGKPAYSTTDQLQGTVVVPNAEVGYWLDAAASAADMAQALESEGHGAESGEQMESLGGGRGGGGVILGTRNIALYANPLLVKLAKAVWSIAPNFSLVGEAHWGRQSSLQRSGIVPHLAATPGALARTVDRTVDKAGTIRVAPRRQGDIAVGALQRALAYDLATAPPGGLHCSVRSLTSSRHPYPTLALERAAWTAVDASRCLPGTIMTFGDETSGAAHRLNIAGAYVHNEAFREEEARRAEARLQRRRARLSALPWAVKAGRAGLTLRVRGGGAQGGQRLLHSSTGDSENSAFSSRKAAAAAAVVSGTSFLPQASSAEGGYEGHIGVGGVVPAMPLRGVGGLRPSASSGSLASSIASAPEDWTGTPPGVEARAPGSDPPSGRVSGLAADRVETFDFVSDAGSVYAGEGPEDDVADSWSQGDDDEANLRHTALGLAGDREPDIIAAALAVAGPSSSGVSLLCPHVLAVDPHGTGAVSRASVGRAPQHAEGVVQAALAAAHSQSVTSWRPPKEQHGTSAQVSHLAWLEGEVRARIGPQFGFDTTKLAAHYKHRDAVRSAYPSLVHGRMALLSARHRFGEHGHVLAFARYTWFDEVPAAAAAVGSASSVGLFGKQPERPADEVCIVACNFNAFASTVSVDASALASVFGASHRDTLAPRSGSGGASEQRPGMRKNYSISDFVSEEGPSDSGWNGSSGVLGGGVWEARDAFQASLEQLQSRQLELAAGLARGSVHPSPLCSADGPLVGFLTSDEAAYAPLQTTLPPFKSFCWVLRPLVDATSPTVSGSSSASLQWVFASAALRLQTMLQLPELGKGTAVRLADGSAGVGDPMASEEVGPSRSMGPGDALRDEEVVAFARHNLLHATMRRVVTDTADHCEALASGNFSAVAGGASPGPASALALSGPALKEFDQEGAAQAASPGPMPLGDALPPHSRAVAVEACAARLLTTLRSLAVHLQLSVAELPPQDEGVDTPDDCRKFTRRLQAAPLPFLPSQDSTTPPSQRWGAVDVEVIVRLLRISLFMACREDPPVSTSLMLSALAHAALQDPHSPAGVLAAAMVADSDLGPIVFVTPELGKWSTVGGLGVMVDELTTSLADMGADVTVVSPFYDVDRKGRGDYLRPDGILYTGRNVGVWVGGQWVELGVHEGRVRGVRLLFLHQRDVFPRPYPTLDARGQLHALVTFAKGALETMCQWRISPGIVVTNDWFTGLMPAYARMGLFGNAFNSTDFMHIAHNLDPSYEGRLYPSDADGDLHWLHGLPRHLLVDDTWSDVVLNPSRCALLASDTWATVSKSYRADLLAGSPLRHILRQAPHPFGHANGIPVALREAKLQRLSTNTHATAKAALQRKYFGMQAPDESIPMFGFVGRITLQKGVHLILNSVEPLLHSLGGRVQFILGGMASASDTYGRACASKMRELAAKHPRNFWADPSAFFTDGPVVNLGCDFGLMPSMFEPGGIVQHEFLVAGTPVLAFRTGGLKDTIQEFSPGALSGNGVLFDEHRSWDFQQAVNRCVTTFRSAPLYEALRRNARASVMDLQQVTAAWCAEFHRVKRCLAAPSGWGALLPGRRGDVGARGGEEGGPGRVRVVLQLGVAEIPGASLSSTVRLAGSFLPNWTATVPAVLSPSGTSFEVSLHLQPGEYLYKWIVDGEWCCSSYQAMSFDASGNANHRLTVHPPAVMHQ